MGTAGSVCGMIQAREEGGVRMMLKAKKNKDVRVNGRRWLIRHGAALDAIEKLTLLIHHPRGKINDCVDIKADG